MVSTQSTLYQSGYIDAKKRINSVEMMPNTCSAQNLDATCAQ